MRSQCPSGLVTRREGFSVLSSCRTAVLARAVVVVLTEKSQHRPSRQFTTIFTANEDRVWRKLGRAEFQQSLRASLSVFR